jgi:hypothetical protein
MRQCSGCFLQRSCGPGADGDVAALEGKLAGDRPADAAAGAGDDGFFAGELQVDEYLITLIQCRDMIGRLTIADTTSRMDVSCP